jgi:ParB family chromosome partitioning protein
MSDQHQLEISLIENIQRRDLNSIETATAYAKLRDQFNLTNDQIAKRVNKSVSAVVNKMRLLKLPKEVVALIAEGQISEGQARPLIGHDVDLIMKIIPLIVAEEWSARKVEQYIVNFKNKSQPNQEDEAAPAENPHENDINQLSKSLGAPIAIRSNAKGAGKILINFKNQAEYERIKNLLSR